MYSRVRVFCGDPDALFRDTRSGGVRSMGGIVKDHEVERRSATFGDSEDEGLMGKVGDSFIDMVESSHLLLEVFTTIKTSSHDGKKQWSFVILLFPVGQCHFYLSTCLFPS
jgi:hypothetical protein